MIAALKPDGPQPLVEIAQLGVVRHAKEQPVGFRAADYFDQQPGGGRGATPPTSGVFGHRCRAHRQVSSEYAAGSTGSASFACAARRGHSH